MCPIRLHLDTSDYAKMYGAQAGTPEARVRDDLLAMKAAGLIEVGLSYHIVFELLQKAGPKFRDDRLSRARFLTQLCGRNAFPYPTDLGEGYGFSTEGLWVPRTDLEDIEIERVVQAFMETSAGDHELSDYQKRVLSKRSYFDEWARANPADFMQLAKKHWPLLFGMDFVDEGGFHRYISGEMSRDEANKALRFYITDPATVYETWFERYGRDNPVRDRRDKMTDKLLEMLKVLEAALDEQAALKGKIEATLAATGDEALSADDREALVKLRREVQSFGSEIVRPEELAEHPAWVKPFGRDGALVGSQIFMGFHREKREIRPSDAIDLVHAMYLPHADLWRGDRAFSHLLIKNRVKFHERVVPALLELPSRIEAAIAQRSEN